MHNFEFVKPSSIGDAVKLLAQEGAQPLSGGQTVVARRSTTPAALAANGGGPLPL